MTASTILYRVFVALTLMMAPSHVLTRGRASGHLTAAIDFSVSSTGGQAMACLEHMQLKRAVTL
jgi:hypothetical protein